MNCKNCGRPIPDQSTFCPYCGVSLERAQKVQPAAPQFTAPYAPPVQQSSGKPKKAKGKVQKCPKCGALLGKKEKVCSICGEAMPKQPPWSKGRDHQHERRHLPARMFYRLLHAGNV